MSTKESPYVMHVRVKIKLPVCRIGMGVKGTLILPATEPSK